MLSQPHMDLSQEPIVALEIPKISRMPGFAPEGGPLAVHGLVQELAGLSPFVLAAPQPGEIMKDLSQEAGVVSHIGRVLHQLLAQVDGLAESLLRLQGPTGLVEQRAEAAVVG